MTGFQRAAVHPPRLMEFYSALANELRGHGVSTIATLEVRDLDGFAGTDPLPDFSTLTDNLILLRQAGMGGELRRLIGVVKMRDSAFDTALHDVVIGTGGLHVANRLILPGSADRESVAPVIAAPTSSES